MAAESEITPRQPLLAPAKPDVDIALTRLIASACDQSELVLKPIILYAHVDVRSARLLPSTSAVATAALAVAAAIPISSAGAAAGLDSVRHL